MSRLRAETMPAVTVPPRLNGLPIAITHSPRRSLSESPNFTATSGFAGGVKFQHRQIGLLVDPDQRRLDLGAVVHDDVDLVSIGNDVVVGHDNARGIDDKTGAERIGLARLHATAALVAARAAAVLEEIVEKFLERRARRK